MQSTGKMKNETITQLIKNGALFVVNHSGGKDSQAMLIKVQQMVPSKQILIIHAHLPEVEWDGIEDQIHKYAQGLPVIVCQSRRKLLDMVRERGMFPSPQQRQCTSDLKRNPIEREIRRFLKANPQYNNQIVNCMGIRAEESPRRAKACTFKFSTRNSKAGRQWYDWLPIHGLTTTEVFDTIRVAGQKPHWAYEAGMSRLSCCFCIMASKHDLSTAARLRPELFKRYVDIENEIGQTMFMPSKKHGRRSLEEVAGITVNEAFES